VIYDLGFTIYEFYFMATVGLKFIAEEARKACEEAAKDVTVRVVMSGGDKWDTGSGTVQRDFSITLED
jgi:hypothetical protein